MLIVAAAPSYYFFNQYKNAQELLKNPNQIAQKEIKDIVEKIGKIYDLPKGEDPTLATVSDKDKLKETPFFLKAENGDKVLIYTKSQVAILYRPSVNKIIGVAPVNLGQTPPPVLSQVKLGLRNGTTTTGLTNKVEPDILKAYPQAKIVVKDNAAKNDYQKTLVIVVNDSSKDAANQIAKNINGSVSLLPAGESQPDGIDILIILGKDKAS